VRTRTRAAPAESHPARPSPEPRPDPTNTSTTNLAVHGAEEKRRALRLPARRSQPVCSPTRTWIGPEVRLAVMVSAAASAPEAVGKAKKKASPCVSTSKPPRAAHASRMTRGCSASASAYASAPSAWRSRVDPSTSVNRKVTVPEESPGRTRGSSADDGRRASGAHPEAPPRPGPDAERLAGGRVRGVDNRPRPDERAHRGWAVAALELPSRARACAGEKAGGRSWALAGAIGAA
jgi:hypothetical protein